MSHVKFPITVFFFLFNAYLYFCFILQALKILIEQRQPCKLSVENALAYYDLVRIKLGPQQFPEFLEIMQENRNPK